MLLNEDQELEPSQYGGYGILRQWDDNPVKEAESWTLAYPSDLPPSHYYIVDPYDFFSVSGTGEYPKWDLLAPNPLKTILDIRYDLPKSNTAESIQYDFFVNVDKDYGEASEGLDRIFIQAWIYLYYTDSSKETLQFLDYTGQTYQPFLWYDFNFHISGSHAIDINKNLDFLRIHIICRRQGGAYLQRVTLSPYSLAGGGLGYRFYGDRPTATEVSQKTNLISIDEEQVTSCKIIDNTQDPYVFYEFLETGNNISYPMTYVWYYDRFEDRRSFEYAGDYQASIRAVNEWGDYQLSDFFNFTVIDTPFPATSYLNVRSFEYRDVPETLFDVYLGEDDRIPLFDFRDTFGDWKPFGNVNFTFGFEQILFSALNGGLRSDFSHIEEGIGYLMEDLVLVFDLKTDSNQMVVIANPSTYDYDYLLTIPSEFANQWVTIEIPFYFFQHFPSGSAFIGELGFYGFSGVFALSNIYLGKFHDSDVKIGLSEIAVPTVEYEETGNFFYEIYALQNNQTKISQPNWDNYSVIIQEAINIGNDLAYESESISYNQIYSSVTDNWNNVTTFFNTNYDGLASQIQNSSIWNNFSNFYFNDPVWDNYSASSNDSLDLQCLSVNQSSYQEFTNINPIALSFDNYSIWINETNFLSNLINESVTNLTTFYSSLVWDNQSSLLSETNFNNTGYSSENIIIENNETILAKESFGNYYGFYSFDQDVLGQNPLGWVANELVDIWEWQDGHYKTVRMIDTSSGDDSGISQSFTAQTDGSVEFWVWSTTATANDYFYFILRDDTTDCIIIEFELDSDGITVHFGDDPADQTTAINIGEWYHFKVDFDSDTDTYTTYINSQLALADDVYENVGVDIDNIEFVTDTSDQGYQVQLDGIDYSWETINGIPYFDFRSYNETYLDSGYYQSKVYDLGVADQYYYSDLALDFLNSQNYTKLSLEYRTSPDNASWEVWSTTNLYYPFTYSHNATNNNTQLGFDWDNSKYLLFYDTSPNPQDEAHIYMNFNLSELFNVENFYLNIDWNTLYTPIYPETKIPKLSVYNWITKSYDHIYSAYNNLPEDSVLSLPFNISNNLNQHIANNGSTIIKLTSGWGNHTVYPSPNGYYDLFIYNAKIIVEAPITNLSFFSDRYFQFRINQSSRFIWDTSEIYNINLTYRLDNLTGHSYNNSAIYEIRFPYIEQENIYEIILNVSSSINDSITLKLFNYSSLTYENLTNNFQNYVNYNLSIDYFNKTHILFRLNSSINPIPFNINVSATINFFSFLNQTQLFSYDLNISTYYILRELLLNLSIEDSANGLDLFYRTSSDNTSWGSWESLIGNSFNYYPISYSHNATIQSQVPDWDDGGESYFFGSYNESALTNNQAFIYLHLNLSDHIGSIEAMKVLLSFYALHRYPVRINPTLYIYNWKTETYDFLFSDIEYYWEFDPAITIPNAYNYIDSNGNVSFLFKTGNGITPTLNDSYYLVFDQFGVAINSQVNFTINDNIKRFLQMRIDLNSTNKFTSAEVQDLNFRIDYQNITEWEINELYIFQTPFILPERLFEILMNLSIDLTYYDISIYNFQDEIWVTYPIDDIPFDIAFGEVSLDTPVFNGTHILINLTKGSRFNYPLIDPQLNLSSFQLYLNITHNVFENATHFLYYDLNESTIHFLNYLTLNYSLNENIFLDQFINGTLLDGFNNWTLQAGRYDRWTAFSGQLEEDGEFFPPIEENGYTLLFAKQQALFGKFIYWQNFQGGLDYWGVGKEYGAVIKAENITEDLFIFTLNRRERHQLTIPQVSIGFLITKNGGNPYMTVNIVRDPLNIYGQFYWNQQATTISLDLFDWNFYSMKIDNDFDISFYINGEFDQTLTSPFNLSWYADDSFDPLQAHYNILFQNLYFPPADWNIPSPIMKIDSIWELNSSLPLLDTIIPTNIQFSYRTSLDNSTWGDWSREYDFSQEINKTIDQFIQIRIDCNTTDRFFSPTFNGFNLDLMYNDIINYEILDNLNFQFDFIDKDFIQGINFTIETTTIQNYSIFIYNFTSDFYDHRQLTDLPYYLNDSVKIYYYSEILDKHIFNETHILVRIFDFNLNPLNTTITAKINISYYQYTNTTYIFNYQLPNATEYFYEKLFFNYTLNNDFRPDGTLLSDFDFGFGREPLYDSDWNFVYYPTLENGYLLCDETGDSVLYKEPINIGEVLGKKIGATVKIENKSDELIIFGLWYPLLNLIIGFSSSDNPLISAYGYTNITDIFSAVSVGIPPTLDLHINNLTNPINFTDWNFLSFEVSNIIFNGTHNISTIDYYVNGIYDNSLEVPYNLSAYPYTLVLQESVWGYPEYSVVKFDNVYELNQHNIDYKPIDIKLSYRTSSDNSSWGIWKAINFTLYETPINELDNQFIEFKVDMLTFNPFHTVFLNEINLQYEERVFTPFLISDFISYNFNVTPIEQINNITINYKINDFLSNDESYPYTYIYNGTIFEGASNPLDDRYSAIRFFDNGNWGENRQSFSTYFFNVSKTELSERLYLKAGLLGRNQPYGSYIEPSIWIYNYNTSSWDLLLEIAILPQHWWWFNDGLIAIDNPQEYVNSSKVLQIQIRSGSGQISVTFGYEILVYYLGIIPDFDIEYGFFNFETQRYDFLPIDLSFNDTIALSSEYFNESTVLTSLTFGSNVAFTITYNSTVTLNSFLYLNTTISRYIDLTSSTFYFYHNFSIEVALQDQTNFTFQWRSSTDNSSWGIWRNELIVNETNFRYLELRIDLLTFYKYNFSEVENVFLNLSYFNSTYYYVDFLLSSTEIANNWGEFYNNHSLKLNIEPNNIPNTIESSISIFDIDIISANFSHLVEIVNKQEVYVTSETFTGNPEGFQTIGGSTFVYDRVYVGEVATVFGIPVSWEQERPMGSYLYFEYLDYDNVLIEPSFTFEWIIGADFDLYIKNFDLDQYLFVTHRGYHNFGYPPYHISSYSGLNTDDFTEWVEIEVDGETRMVRRIEIIIETDNTYFLWGTSTSKCRIDYLGIKVNGFTNISAVTDLDIPMDFDWTIDGNTVFRIQHKASTPFSISIPRSEVVFNYSEVFRFAETIINIDNFTDVNEFSFWYKFQDSRSELELSYYNNETESWEIQTVFSETPLNFAYFGTDTARFQQYWENLTLLTTNYTQIRFYFTFCNITFLEEFNTFTLKRLELIEYNPYRLESSENQQNWDVLTFTKLKHTLLLVDFAGRQIYRKDHDFEQYINIFLNIGEISLKNFENFTVWFAFESRGVTIQYAVPPDSERNVLLLLGDYLVKIYDSIDTILLIRAVSLTTTNKTSISIGIPTIIDIPDPISRGLWDILGEALGVMGNWLITDMYGNLTFGILIFLIGLYVFRWYRGRRKEESKQEKQIKRKAYNKGFKDAVSGKGLPKKKIRI